MSSKFLARSRKWVGASALAILVGFGGGSAFLAASAPVAVAQMTDAAQISVPATNPAFGFADLVEGVKPAVVSIIVEGREVATSRFGDRFNERMPDLPKDDPFRQFLERFGTPFGDQRATPRPEREVPRQGRRFVAAGSGFAITADGYVVTNNHVVRNASKVTVILDDGTEYVANVVGTDEKTDLAVVKIDGVTDMTFAQFASESPRVGDWVVAVGNPFGFGGSVTAGIVSALGRDVQGSAYGDFLQIDAAINTGNSGGPAFNMKGEVVGVNSEIYTPNGGNVGIAFAIPAHTVKQVTTSLIENGVVIRGFLGVTIQNVDRDIADSVDLESARGALVTQLTDDSPGGKAGLKAGDIILSVDDTKIDDAISLSRTIASKAPGTEVELTVWRDGGEITLSATLGELKEQAAAAPETPQQPDEAVTPTTSSVGAVLVPAPEGNGLLVQSVEEDSVAASKGIAAGDVIVEVNDETVTTVREFEKVLSDLKDAGRSTARIRIERNGDPRYVGLPLKD
jgi:serine protease Do